MVCLHLAFAVSLTPRVQMKPIEGAESGGAFGFFKGVGQGLVGAVTKPVVGVFDLASNVGAGMLRVTNTGDSLTLASRYSQHDYRL